MFISSSGLLYETTFYPIRFVLYVMCFLWELLFLKAQVSDLIGQCFPEIELGSLLRKMCVFFFNVSNGVMFYLCFVISLCHPFSF
jgi:hypothetical protein